MRTLFAFALVLALSSTLAVAHGPGAKHSHKPLSQSQAVDAAKKVVKTMVSDKAVDASWTKASVSGAEKRVREDKTEWVVILNNTAISEESKQRLYVFLSETGEYLAANHSGR
jgi:hypothetical protein